MNASLKRDDALATTMGCLAFALTATVMSLVIIAMQAWDKGGPTSWRWLWTSFGMFTVLVVHGLFAVCRPTGWRLKLIMHLTWWICVCFVATGHVGFFLSLHKEAGTQRAEAIKMDSTLTNPNRPLTQVRKEQERVQNTLVRAESISCADDCAVHRLKITQLRNRAKVLDAEENEYLRWQNANDRLDIRRDAAREDPVMTILADWFGVTAERFSMIMGLLFTMILEGVGALCWIEVARRRDSTAGLAVTNPVTNADTRPDTSALKSTESAALQTSRTKKENDLDQKITKVREAIAASQIRPTVNEIMRFLRCGRAKACKVRTAVAQA